MVGFIIDNIGTWELLIILLVALMVFGPEKVPELARNAAKLGRKLSKMTNEFKDEFSNLIDLDEDEEFRRKIASKTANKEMLKQIVDEKTTIGTPSMSAAPIISRSESEPGAESSDGAAIKEKKPAPEASVLDKEAPAGSAE